MSNHDRRDGPEAPSGNFFEEFSFAERGIDLDARLESTIESDISEYDEAYVQVLKATLGTAAVLDAVDMADRRRVELRDGVDSAYLEELEAAHECGGKILARAAETPAIKEDLSELDTDLLSEARGSLVYVATHLGIDVDFPQPDMLPPWMDPNSPFERQEQLRMDFDSEYSGGYETVLRVLYLTSDILMAMKSRAGAEAWPPSSESRPPEYVETIDDIAERADQPYVDGIEAAFTTTRAVMNQADENPAIQYDLGELDSDLLADVRETVGPVGQHLGVEVSLPSASGGKQ